MGAFILLTLLAACGSAPQQGEGNYLLDDIDAQRTLPDVGWDALKSKLPPVPTAADRLLPIEPLARNPHFRFGIDPRSIEVAPGAIVRYTLRAVSDQGAENISYESVRCGMDLWRPVALYQPDKGWQRPLNEDWRTPTPGSIQAVLRRGVFCTGGGAAVTTPEGLAQRLRYWERHADGLAGNANK